VLPVIRRGELGVVFVVVAALVAEPDAARREAAVVVVVVLRQLVVVVRAVAVLVLALREVLWPRCQCTLTGQRPAAKYDVVIGGVAELLMSPT